MTTSIILIGDLHGNVARLKYLDSIAPAGVPFLQLGDLGWWPGEIPSFEAWGKQAQRMLYWIKGNHEYFPRVPVNTPVPVELAQNITYVPGGHVLELGTKRLGCLGGASSIDRQSRTAGYDWFFEENILPIEEERVKSWGKVDLMLTHVPPQYMIETHFSRADMVRNWAVDYGWTDTNAVLVGHLWKSLGCPSLYCGHMHRAVNDGYVRILDIDEALEVVL